MTIEELKNWINGKKVVDYTDEENDGGNKYLTKIFLHNDKLYAVNFLNDYPLEQYKNGHHLNDLHYPLPQEVTRKIRIVEKICRNSHYFINRLTKEQKKEQYKKFGGMCGKKYFAFTDSLCPAFLCPLSVIEALTGEEYDFGKHIKPLIDEGLIWIRKYKNCFPHSKELEKSSYKNHGVVMDYKDKIKYLQFYLGKVDPNKGKTFEDAWI